MNNTRNTHENTNNIARYWHGAGWYAYDSKGEYHWVGSMLSYPYLGAAWIEAERRNLSRPIYLSQ